MTIEDDMPSTADGAPLSAPPRWTLADFLSSYRYWALYLAALLVALGGQSVGIILPIMLTGAGSTIESIGIFHLGLSVGWIVGAFVAFVVAPRSGRPALIWPVVGFIGAAIAFLLMPAFWSSPVVLIVFGVACGAAQGVFPLALAVFLIGGRPGRIDFAGGLLLLSAPVLTGVLAPIGVSMLYQSAGGWAVGAGLVGCLGAAVAVLLPARRLGFDDAPPRRHRPLQPRRRSPIAVAAFLLAPPVLSALAGLAFHLASPMSLGTGKLTPVLLALAFLLFCIAVAALVYLAVWLYRIHGELAGAAASQRLLTPLAAVPIAFLVPLGLPVLLLTLGELLNDRARGRADERSISIAWLAIWSVLLPPVAIAMIQHAANGSYDGARDAT